MFRTHRSRGFRAAMAATVLGLSSVAIVAPLAQANHRSDGAAQREGDFSCRASTLRVLGIEPIVANDPGSPCVTDDGLLADIVAGPVSANVLHANTKVTLGNDPSGTQPTRDVDPAVGDKAEAKAGVAFADVNLTGLHVVANVLEARASAECATVGDHPADAPTLSASSDVVSLSINGTAIAVPPGHQDIPIPGLATIHLNEVINGTNSITARALWIETAIPGVGDIVVGEATANFEDIVTGATPDPADGNPCEQTPGEGCPPDSPENDPFVDPTAPDTFGHHPDCREFSEPQGMGEDKVKFDRHINDTDTSPNGSFVPDNSDPDSRNSFNGEAGFDEDETMPHLKGDIYDDEDMRFRLAPLSIDAYFAPDDDPNTPWRRFCGTGVIQGEDDDVDNDGDHDAMDDVAALVDDSSDGNLDDEAPVAPFASGQERKFMIEVFDAKSLNEEASGGNQSDYFVIDIYAPGSSFDTHQCDPDPGGPRDHEGDDLDYHSEGQTIAGNIEIHSERRVERS